MARPPKYNETYPEDLVKLMEQGMLNCEIYAKWGIHKDTFYQWINTHKEFKEAYDIGLAKCEAWWVARGRDGVSTGKGFGFNPWIAIMNNKFGWAQGSRQGEGTTNNITIGSVNLLANQSNPQLLDYIKTMTLKHQDIIDIQLIEDKTNSSENSDDQSKPE